MVHGDPLLLPDKLDRSQCMTLTVERVVAASEVCVDSFSEEYQEKEGVSSRCPRVGHLYGSTVDDCVKETCRLGGNTINYRNHECELRRCQLSLNVTDKAGGWEVLSLDVPRTYPPIAQDNIYTGSLQT